MTLSNFQVSTPIVLLFRAKALFGTVVTKSWTPLPKAMTSIMDDPPNEKTAEKYNDVVDDMRILAAKYFNQKTAFSFYYFSTTT